AEYEAPEPEPQEAAAPPDAGGFGAEVFEAPAAPEPELLAAVPEPPRAHPAEAPDVVEEAPPAAASEEPVAAPDRGEPLTARPGTELGEEPPRGRRRAPRGGSRRRGRAADKEAEAAKEEAPEAPAEGGGDDEPPRPLTMESAEHRTTGKDDDPGAPH